MAFSLFKKKKRDNIEERAVNGDILVSEGSGAELLVAALKGSGCVTEDTAMQIPSIARCVNMIASAAAMLPVKMYRKNAGGKPEEIKDDPRIALLNSETGDTMNADSMRYAWVKDYLLQGGGYAYIERRNGIPSGFFYISPSEVGVLKNTEDPIYKKFNYSVRGKNYFPFQMLKILRNSDGYGKGRGVIKDNSMIIDTAYAMIKFQRSQLLKGGSKKGFLKTESKIGKDVMEEIRDKWRELYSAENNDSVMLLNAGIDFKEISNTSVEMQINQNIQTINSEIMKLFGTEDGILSEATVKNSVMPVLDAMEAAFDSDLLLESEKGNTYFAFDARELTRGDIGSRYAAYSIALEKNFMQLDEVRELEDLPPLGINFITLGLNDVLLDPKTNKIYTPNTNAMVDLGSGAGAVIENSSEIRFNKNHDPENGRFTGGGNNSNNSSEKSIDKSGESGIIKAGSDVAVHEDIKSINEQSIFSGAISGALNPYSEEAAAHAEQYYEAVRHMKTDITRISENTGFSEKEISQVKNYIFIQKHDLGGTEPELFSPSFEMAQSWQRLIDGKNIQPHDLTLLKHEIKESNLMKQGFSQETAHEITEKELNYSKECKEYYAKINKHN
ncbi:MAG: phage portal protein [Ruminococcus sp.]|nr:phage portal protein [Ruminococcus sp.]